MVFFVVVYSFSVFHMTLVYEIDRKTDKKKSLEERYPAKIEAKDLSRNMLKYHSNKIDGYLKEDSTSRKSASC